MLDYSKVVQLIKKELPSATQEDIDHMISTIPSGMPYLAVKSMIKLTKHLIDNPAKRKLLKLKNKTNHHEEEIANHQEEEIANHQEEEIANHQEEEIAENLNTDSNPQEEEIVKVFSSDTVLQDAPSGAQD